MGDSDLSLHSLADFLLKVNTKPDELFNLIDDDNARLILEARFEQIYLEKYKHLFQQN